MLISVIWLYCSTLDMLLHPKIIVKTLLFKAPQHPLAPQDDRQTVYAAVYALSPQHDRQTIEKRLR